jgi:hypothetical protein
MDEFATWNYITKFTNKKKKTLPSYGSCRWCTPLQVICILQLLSQWIVCVPPIHFIMRISCFWLLCVHQISREDKSFFSKHWEMLNIWGENTLPCAWRREWNEWMNDLRAHKIWASRTLNNNKQQQQEACCFSIVLPWNKEDICSALSAWKLEFHELLELMRWA